jgi:Transglutaminase-like superfamily
MSRIGVTGGDAPTFAAKLALAGRVAYWFVIVEVWLRRLPLAEVVERLGRVKRPRPQRLNSGRLGRGVARLLRIGPIRARCLVMALVHYRLLREQGDPAQLVVGLEDTPRTRDAHAWVEIGGIDVGPPPGRGLHRGLLRYG